MAVPAAVLNTTSDHGGKMITATGTFFTTPGGAGPVCLLGDTHECPIPGHGNTPIVSGTTLHATTNGTSIAIQGSKAECGATLNGAFASNTFLT